MRGIMINYKTGNIFESNAQVIVNTVNCEGIMGRGLAFEFKNRFPKMYDEYKKICEVNELYPGKLHLYSNEKPWIVNFPTKRKWREKSTVEIIEKGLIALKRLLVENDINSIAIPALGAGNGGLNWNVVRNLIEEHLIDISEQIDIEVYEPSHNVDKTKMSFKSSYFTLALLFISINLRRFNKNNLMKVIQISNNIFGRNYDIRNIEKEFTNIRMIKEYYHLKDNAEVLDLLLSQMKSEKLYLTLDKELDILKKSIGILEEHYEISDELIARSERVRNKNSTYNSDKIDDILINTNQFSINLWNEIFVFEGK